MNAMILVSLRYDGGLAAVYRDAGRVWLGVRPDGAARFGGTSLDTRPGQVGVGGRRMVVGGLLPPEASVAMVEGVRAATGDGAWIALVGVALMDHEPAVRYEAGDGTIVRHELPAGWPREPVADADEPCPACGAATWERVTPRDDSRGTNGDEPAPVIACTRCGHEVSEGAWYAPAPRGLKALRRRRRRVPPPPPHLPAFPPVAEAGFPVYGLAGAEPEVSGYGSSPDAGVHTMRIRHDGVVVTTRMRRAAFLEADDEAASALASVIHDAEPWDWGRGSDAARALRIHARRRAVAARVARAEPFAVELPVDGEPVRFEGFREPAGWAAVGGTAHVLIVIAAHGTTPEAIALRRL